MFTKGKWEHGKDAGIWCNGQKLATILYCIDNKNAFKVCEEEAGANARLIAAAPKLLEACKLAISCMAGYEEMQGWRSQIEAAIALAEG